MRACVFCVGPSHKAMKYVDSVYKEQTGTFSGYEYLCKERSDSQILMRKYNYVMGKVKH